MRPNVGDENMRLQCPTCRAITWSRDGFTMSAGVNGQLNRIRVAGTDPAAVEDPWACGRCGYRAPFEGDLARHLTEVQVAHVD